MKTLLDMFITRAERHPDEISVVSPSGMINLKRLMEGSAQVAGAFDRLGLRPGDRIALHLYNLPELITAYLACWRIGALAVPINTRYKLVEIDALFARIRPKAYIAEAELARPLMEDNIPHLPRETCFLVNAGTGSQARPWADLLQGRPSKPYAGQAEDHAVLLATSGTTGERKLVVWTQKTLVAIAEHFHDRDLFPDDVILVQMPMMHAGGLLQMIYALAFGAKLVLTPRFDADLVLDAIEAHRCTSFLGAPTMCAEMIRRQQVRARDLSSLRTCVVAGDICPPETEQAFQAALGRPLYSRWGATEDVCAALRGRRVGPFVTPAPDAEIRIIANRRGSDMREGFGELATRCEGTTPGYWRAPGQVDPLPDGWFYSGDLVQAEAEDRLRFVGREKDLIVRAGSNISPVAVEQALARHPRVADAAVVSVQDDELGQRVGAVLVLNDDNDETDVADLIEQACADMADYMTPERVRIVDAIHRNALSKIDRGALVEGEWRSI